MRIARYSRPLVGSARAFSEPFSIDTPSAWSVHSVRHSPDMPETISGAEMRRNGTPLSLATALARAVLPQPGGPCSRMPRGGSTPSRAYTCRAGGSGSASGMSRSKEMLTEASLAVSLEIEAVMQ